jgi:hypothetical protein
MVPANVQQDEMIVRAKASATPSAVRKTVVYVFIIDAVAGGLAFDTGNKKATMAIAALSFVFNFFWHGR